MSAAVYVVVGIFSVMFAAFSLVGLENKPK